MSLSLPAGFEDLEVWLHWSLPTMAQRSARRRSSDMDDLRAFYAALLPRMGEILTYLSSLSAGDGVPQNQALLNLTKSLAEIAPAVELFNEPAISYGYEVARFSTDPE